MKKDKGRMTLYCFSPLIMIITFVIEIALAIYTLYKSHKAKSDIGIVITLVFLAIFQLSEYQICGGSDLLFWARLGLFCITFLPVVGLYLISKLGKGSYLLRFYYFIAIAFAAYFVFVPQSIQGVSCGGNYVIFNIQTSIHSLYGFYYFGFLLLGIWEAVKGIKLEHNKEKIKKALKWLIIGYLSFILPLTLVYILLPITRVGIASIMCGFAIIFALILTFKIAPIYHEYVKVEHKSKK